MKKSKHHIWDNIFVVWHSTIFGDRKPWQFWAKLSQNQSDSTPHSPWIKRQKDISCADMWSDTIIF